MFKAVLENLLLSVFESQALVKNEYEKRVFQLGISARAINLQHKEYQ